MTKLILILVLFFSGPNLDHHDPVIRLLACDYQQKCDGSGTCVAKWRCPWEE